jgi:hypothetical protein
LHSGDFRTPKNGVNLHFARSGRSGQAENKRKEASHMAISSHLAELEKRHQALEQEITEALTHPSSDGLKIAELKRKKLHVKDEMERLRHDTLVH